MPVQVIYKKAFSAVLFHPLQHLYYLEVGKMMAKQGTENNVWFIRKNHLPVITANKLYMIIIRITLCKIDTFGIDINSQQVNLLFVFFSPLADHPDIVT